MSESEKKNKAKELQAALELVNGLPPLPEVVVRAMQILNDPHASTGEISKVISQDATLAVRVIKVANSALFSRRTTISSLDKAIVLVGYKIIKGLVIAAGLQKSFGSQHAGSKVIWQNGFATALIAGEIANMVSVDYREEAFTHGLLHDLGKIAMLTRFPARYAKVLQSVQSGITFQQAEDLHFDFDHTVVGQLIAKKWELPNDISEIIFLHHDQFSLTDCCAELRKVAIVQAADLTAYAIGCGSVNGYPDMSVKAQALLREIGVDDFQNFCERSTDLCLANVDFFASPSTINSIGNH